MENIRYQESNCNSNDTMMHVFEQPLFPECLLEGCQIRVFLLEIANINILQNTIGLKHFNSMHHGHFYLIP